MIATYFINLIFNSVMLTPLLYTGNFCTSSKSNFRILCLLNDHSEGTDIYLLLQFWDLRINPTLHYYILIFSLIHFCIHLVDQINERHGFLEDLTGASSLKTEEIESYDNANYLRYVVLASFASFGVLEGILLYVYLTKVI